MSRLEDNSKEYRDENLKRNAKLYTENKPYSSGSKRALSDGDEWGKGDNGSGQVGGKTDIKTRKTLMTKNTYNRNKEYNDKTA